MDGLQNVSILSLHIIKNKNKKGAFSHDHESGQVKVQKNLISDCAVLRNLPESFFPEFHKGSTPAPSIFTSKLVLLYQWQFFKNGVNRPAQIARSLSMNYPDLENICFQTLIQIIRNQVFQILWRKIMQI